MGFDVACDRMMLDLQSYTIVIKGGGVTRMPGYQLSLYLYSTVSTYFPASRRVVKSLAVNFVNLRLYMSLESSISTFLPEKRPSPALPLPEIRPKFRLKRSACVVSSSSLLLDLSRSIREMSKPCIGDCSQPETTS